MSRLALVSSLEEGRDKVVEGLNDGGMDSKLAVILLQLAVGRGRSRTMTTTTTRMTIMTMTTRTTTCNNFW